MKQGRSRWAALAMLAALLPMPAFAAADGAPSAAAFGPRIALPVADSAHSVTADDMNGDGHLDLLVVTVGNDSVGVLLGDSRGNFQAPRYFPVGDAPKSVATGDFNRDGSRDIVTAEQSGNSISVLLGRGDGSFGERVAYKSCNGAYEVAVADIDADGSEDIVVACLGPDRVGGIFLGHGDGTFQPRQDVTAGPEPHSLAVADLDLDGHLDLLFANHGSDTLSVQLSQAGEGFRPAPDLQVSHYPHAVRVADLDADGFPDIIAVNDANVTVSVLWGSAQGFTARDDLAVMSLPKSLAVADVNGDGLADLIVTNTTYPHCCTWTGSAVRVLLNAGQRRFGEPQDYFIGGNPFSLWVGDLNADGRADIVTANYRDLPAWLHGNSKVARLIDAGLGSPTGRYLRIAAFGALGILIVAVTWRRRRWRLAGLAAAAIVSGGLVGMVLWARSIKDLSHVSILFGS